MKKPAKLPLVTVILGVFVLGAPIARAQVTLINETFADGLRNGTGRATQWYSTATAGAGNEITANTTFGGSYAMQFWSSWGNSIAVAAFKPVTLVKAGDYIRISSQIYYTSLTNTTNTGPLLGLFNSGATQITADAISSTAYADYFADDAGYKATKLASASANDVKIQSQTAGSTNAFYHWSGAPVKIEDSGFTLQANTIYATTLTLTLADNLTDLNITYEITGGSGENAVSHTASVTTTATTLTFNEAVIAAFSGQSATQAYMSNILVTSNIPEPSTVAMLIGAASLIPLLLRYRRCHR
ncbi:hypothetical protein OPIT5_29745 [Opitutaceae bacterium TAV5]|nr:hypothetical protein OPIT5_29745 [Opitutaceae bacterium TAV5]